MISLKYRDINKDLVLVLVCLLLAPGLCCSPRLCGFSECTHKGKKEKHKDKQ